MILLGDLYLLIERITGDFNDFIRLRSEGILEVLVCRRNKQNLTEIKGNIHVVVYKGIILFGIQS